MIYPDPNLTTVVKGIVAFAFTIISPAPDINSSHFFKRSNLFWIWFSTAAVVALVKGTVGLVCTMAYLHVDALVAVQPVVLTGRGQTAQAQTTVTGNPGSQRIVKSTRCLWRTVFGTDSQVVKASNLYAKHVSSILTLSFW